MQNKKGVSLITVLLFMLIATIAATATYKWLTSENRTSASRMQMSQAREASKAGLEAIRSWMTYHGNDVGALIHQYKKGSDNPVFLNKVACNHLSGDACLGSDGKSKYRVWLAGVDTEKSPYKLKIISSGESSNGTQYNESSVLAVSGLYRIKIPQEMLTLSYDQAFDGNLGNATGSNTLESAIIHGDLNGNTPRVDNKLIVAGKATLQGKQAYGSDVYIKGDYSNQGQWVVGAENPGSGDISNLKCPAGGGSKVVYIGGNMKDCAGGDPLKVCGDLYVHGNIAGNCKFDVSGNMTVNGELVRDGNYAMKVGGHLVFTDKAKLTIKVDNLNLEIGGNLYLPKEVGESNFGDQNKNRKITVSGSVY
ncbi:MAG: pilus assembly PilX N-terminal domain-containing protein, partial [Fibrobacter sp.]|nr:pilus assembly PilX N-terminal domain-containing protein [Fibrobacter sp.]